MSPSSADMVYPQYGLHAVQCKDVSGLLGSHRNIVVKREEEHEHMSESPTVQMRPILLGERTA